MGTVIYRLIFIVFFATIFTACSALQNGQMNQHGQYVPKKLRFKLKDKSGIFPKELDTLNFYQMVEMYNNGVLVYPKSSLSDELQHSYIKELNESAKYIKFYPQGRCAIFSVNTNGRPINYTDFDPQNANKGYYFSPNGIQIQLEHFVYGDGNGHYVITNYILNNDSLIMQEKHTRIVYKRIVIPEFGERFKVDW